MSDETKPRNFCVRDGKRTLNVARFPGGGVCVHANIDSGLPQYSASVDINEAQAKRLAAYLDPEPRRTERHAIVGRLRAEADECAAEAERKPGQSNAGHLAARDALLAMAAELEGE